MEETHRTLAKKMDAGNRGKSTLRKFWRRILLHVFLSELKINVSIGLFTPLHEPDKKLLPLYFFKPYCKIGLERCVPVW